MNQCNLTILRSTIAAFLTWATLSSSSSLAVATEPWIDQYRLSPPEAFKEQIADFISAELPSFTVTPAGHGEQFVRLSLPLAAGALADGVGLQVVAEGEVLDCGWRVLTHHPGTPRWVRRGMISFVYQFRDAEPVNFSLRRALPVASADQDPTTIGPVNLTIDATEVRIRWNGGQSWRVKAVGPQLSSEHVSHLETVERNPHYLWLRLLVADPIWPRIIEVRADSQGGVVLNLQIQRRETGDAYAPDLGWQLELPDNIDEQPTHHFSEGQTCSFEVSGQQVSFPLAVLNRKGQAIAKGNELTYLRSTNGDRTPMQSTAWRNAVVAIQPVGTASLTPLLQPSHAIAIPQQHFEALYQVGPDLNLAPWPEIDSLRQFTRDGIVSAALQGDDAGNVTSFGPGQPASVFGMNRLNHCPAIFEEYFRSSDARLRETAVRWCENTHDLSIWWGADDYFGGTRYNNAVSNGATEHAGDDQFMWRTNGGQHSFCTKGYDSFFYAWEETGDPRMATALRHQLAYAGRHVHVNRGEARNIGDAADFLRLHRFTGQPEYRDQALRLWRQLREVLGEDGLFSQSGKPIIADRPFIDDDAAGYHFPFAKPYIIGYALAGCPALIEQMPDEPRLREMVFAVSKMLAGSVDPAGGWRYPAPESSSLLISQGLEHAAQLVRAAEALEGSSVDTSQLLNAIETVLQARLGGWLRTRQVLAGLSGWERTGDLLANGETLHDRYPRPADRDRSLDYDQGAVSVGGAPPEGLVYFSEVLEYYLRNRPADRLYQQSPELQRVLARTERLATQTPTNATDPITTGVRNMLPTYNDQRVAEMRFPMARRQNTSSFQSWRKAARVALMSSVGDPPPRAAFNTQVLASEDRGSYTSLKVAININQWHRVIGYLLIPKGAGPFPAVLALHDHGAHFSIGKEKVVRPFDVSESTTLDAQQWVDRYYAGRWIGDALAERGFVVFATDALFWGDRGREGGVDYEEQQALGANLMQLGMSWAGTILWDDIRSAEFLQSRPEVIPERIGAIGLSLGGFRTWNLVAASDVLQAGAAICWLGDTEGLTAAGNNQTRGQSAFSMIQPYIRNSLDYPDVASIACPKPMLFQNGQADSLFPVPSVQRAYQTMEKVWQAEGVADRLQTSLWPVAHLFDAPMQQEAFTFLERWLKP